MVLKAADEREREREREREKGARCNANTCAWHRDTSAEPSNTGPYQIRTALPSLLPPDTQPHTHHPQSHTHSHTHTQTHTKHMQLRVIRSTTPPPPLPLYPPTTTTHQAHAAESDGVKQRAELVDDAGDVLPANRRVRDVADLAPQRHMQQQQQQWWWWWWQAGWWVRQVVGQAGWWDKQVGQAGRGIIVCAC